MTNSKQTTSTPVYLHQCIGISSMNLIVSSHPVRDIRYSPATNASTPARHEPKNLAPALPVDMSRVLCILSASLGKQIHSYLSTHVVSRLMSYNPTSIDSSRLQDQRRVCDMVLWDVTPRKRSLETVASDFRRQRFVQL